MPLRIIGFLGISAEETSGNDPPMRFSCLLRVFALYLIVSLRVCD
jgi:hypothetical protein